MSSDMRVNSRSAQQNQMISQNKNKGCLPCIRRTADRVSEAFDLYFTSGFNMLEYAFKPHVPLKKPLHPLPENIKIKICVLDEYDEAAMAEIEQYDPECTVLTKEQYSYLKEKAYRHFVYQNMTDPSCETAPSLRKNREFLQQKYAFLIQE